MASSFNSPSNDGLIIEGTLNQIQDRAGTTLMGWAYATSFVNTENYVCGFVRNGSTTAAKHILSARNSGVFRTTCRRLDADAATILDSTAGVAVTGQWFHLASVADWANGTLTIYVNGVPNNTTSPAGWTGNSENTVATSGAVGIRGDLSTSSDWDGYLEDIRIYTRALTANEVLSIYSAKGKDNILDSLINRWMLTGVPGAAMATGTGNAQKDLCGNNNLTEFNGPTYGSLSTVSWRR